MTSIPDMTHEVGIAPQDLASWLERKTDAPYLLDVRDPEEFMFASIKGAISIPLTTLPERLAELPKDKTIVAICHHGMRSMRAVEFLRQNGFEETFSLNGGMDVWSRDIDPTCPRY